MLRGTCRFFRDFATEPQIHDKFLELEVDVMDDFYILGPEHFLNKQPCSSCPSFIGEDTYTPEQVKMKSQPCGKCGRKYFNISRPGVLRVGEQIEIEECFECSNVDEAAGTVNLCEDCWASPTSGGRKERREQFCARYGRWLHLVWQYGPAISPICEPGPGVLFHESSESDMVV